MKIAFAFDDPKKEDTFVVTTPSAQRRKGEDIVTIDMSDTLGQYLAESVLAALDALEEDKCLKVYRWLGQSTEKK